MDTLKLHILIPVYNEAENIAKNLHEIEAKVSTPHEILIIYDFDEDTTLPVIHEYCKKHPDADIRLVKNDLGPGVLNALKKAFGIIRDGATLVTMADLSDDYTIVDDMAGKIRDGFDIVCGSRYMKGGSQVGGSFLKALLSRFAGFTLHYLTGIPTFDVTNNFKMYRADLLREITLESTGGFEVALEILVKSHALGKRITEVPVVWRDRSAGESKFRLLQWLPQYLRWYLYAILHIPCRRCSRHQ